MKRKLLFTSVLVMLGTVAIMAHKGSSKLIAKNVAVFYPENYDARQHSPSFALLKEPSEVSNLPQKWSLTPNFYIANGKSIASIAVAKGTSVYGTGEVTGSLLRNGKSVKLWNTDNFKYSIDEGKRLYQSHPWALGVNVDGTAFGVLADNTWKQGVEITDSIRFISEGPAFRLIIIQRNTPQEVMMELAQLVGKMEMPPLWSLGYQQSRYSYVPDTRIKGIADTFRLKKLPCDVIWMDIDYMEKFKIFTFDKVKIPHPEEVNNYLHQKGFKGVWMIDPGVKVEKDYFVYESGSQGNHWVQTSDKKEFNGKVWPGACAFPDFTRPETRSWWGDLYADFMSKGVDGVWNDMNEPSVFDGPDGTMPVDNWHRGGGELSPGSHLRYHNVYGMLMVKASREGILKTNAEKRPFILSRSGFLGSHRYAATWTGDNCGTAEHMKMSIPMTLNLGLSGQPFNGPDLGGFGTSSDGELFGQWMAVGVFFPFVRGHAAIDVNNKEPWAFGTDIENVSRTALNRRYRLLPYYYTLFHEAAQTGMPVMRPLFFADAKDASLRAEDQVFLVGNDLLIVPKWAQNPHLPAGNWRQVSLAGENSKTDHYQSDVSIREGAIVPLGSLIQNTTEYTTDSITLLVSTDRSGKAVGTLYEDAGDGFGYKKGEYLLTRFNAVAHGRVLTVQLQSLEGKLERPHRKIKIQWVMDGQVIEGDWLSGTKIEVLRK